MSAFVCACVCVCVCVRTLECLAPTNTVFWVTFCWSWARTRVGGGGTQPTREPFQCLNANSGREVFAPDFGSNRGLGLKTLRALQRERESKRDKDTRVRGRNCLVCADNRK